MGGKKRGVEREGKTDEVIKGKADAVQIGIFPVNEVVHSEYVCCVNGFGVGGVLLQRADDDVRVDDGEVKGRGMVFLEFPRGLLGEFLGGVVAENDIFGSDRLFGGDLEGEGDVSDREG